MIFLIAKALAEYDTNLEVVSNTSTFPDLITKIANIVGIVAGALAFIFLLYSGILYITAGGNTDQAKKAQTGIINTIIGIVIIIFAYVIFSAVRREVTSLGGG